MAMHPSMSGEYVFLCSPQETVSTLSLSPETWLLSVHVDLAFSGACCNVDLGKKKCIPHDTVQLHNGSFEYTSLPPKHAQLEFK